MTKKRTILFWIISIIIMLIIVVYQRVTGPTYPISGKLTISSEKIEYTLPRSHAGAGNEIVKIKVPNKTTGKMIYKRFPSYDDWSEAEMQRKGKELIAEIPHQDIAGKIMYKIQLNDGNKTIELTEEPVIIRFRGDVPIIIVIFHVALMFITITFSVRTGFEAIYKGRNTLKLALITCISLIIGGAIFGPLMQKYAFGAYWTGWPFGHDLTDNKTIVGLIIWLIAYWRLRKNNVKQGWAIAASIILLIVYLIPHSLLGSEIDYTKIQK